MVLPAATVLPLAWPPSLPNQTAARWEVIQKLAFVWRHRLLEVSVVDALCAWNARCYELTCRLLRASDAAEEMRTPETCSAGSWEIRSSARRSAGLSLARRSSLPTYCML